MFIAVMHFSRGVAGAAVVRANYCEYAMLGATEEEAVGKLLTYMGKQGWHQSQYPVFVGELTARITPVVQKVDYKKEPIKKAKA